MLTNQKSKKIAILQSNYLPWKGYFDLISSVDEFVLYDDMQYSSISIYCTIIEIINTH